jgi:hypothetical protein
MGRGVAIPGRAAGRLLAIGLIAGLTVGAATPAGARHGPRG